MRVLVLSFLFIVTCSQSVFAGTLARDMKYLWDVPNSDVVRPYLYDYQDPHNSQWADDHWKPSDWTERQGRNAFDVVNGFYEAGIVTDQYTDGDGAAVLEVGQVFLQISDLERHRIVAFFDHVFQVTSSTVGGVIRIVFYENDEKVGLFTKDDGLQLQ